MYPRCWSIQKIKPWTSIRLSWQTYNRSFRAGVLGVQSTVWGDSHMLPSKGCKGLSGLPYTENREDNQSAFRLPSG
jgi:hypothetical protein